MLKESKCQCKRHKRHGFIPWVGKIPTLGYEMAAHSSILASKMPWTEEPGELLSVGSQRVGHDWACTCTLLDNVKPNPYQSVGLASDPSQSSDLRYDVFLTSLKPGPSLPLSALSPDLTLVVQVPFFLQLHRMFTLRFISQMLFYGSDELHSLLVVSAKDCTTCRNPGPFIIAWN